MVSYPGNKLKQEDRGTCEESCSKFPPKFSPETNFMPESLLSHTSARVNAVRLLGCLCACIHCERVCVTLEVILKGTSSWPSFRRSSFLANLEIAVY